MLIPTYLKQAGGSLPTLEAGESRYVVAANGTFLERRTSMYATSVRASLASALDDHEEYCLLGCGRLPRTMHRAMLGFFKYAHEVHGGEVALVLLFHPERRTFRWHCPLQIVDLFQTARGWAVGDTIEFQNPLALPEGYVHFGDAHLHPGAPTPSTLDVQDDQDGLHIIVGNIRTAPRYYAVFVMDRVRFTVPPEAIFEDPNCRPFAQAPKRWLRQIRLRRNWPADEARKLGWR
jgi:hypothetical protein